MKKAAFVFGAEFSPCRRYRYVLWRFWGDGLFSQSQNYLAFIGLNPSTADETANDPTIRRCMGFARDHGFDGIYMLNLFAFRATDPKVMKAEREPVGPDNDCAIARYAAGSKRVVAAWGTHGKYQGRDEIVIEMVPRLYCLGQNGDGTPKHPLYLPKSALLVELNP